MEVGYKMLSELVAALPYYVMGIGSSLTVLLRSCSLKISCWKFLAIMWGKTIIVNILILAVIKHYYGNTMAVSYTHLDVYKRQIQEWSSRRILMA